MSQRLRDRKKGVIYTYKIWYSTLLVVADMQLIKYIVNKCGE